jgi:hypothetical protein
MRFAIVLLAWGNVAGAAPTLTATAYGQIVFGERLEVIEARLNERVRAVIDSDETHCRLVEFKAYPRVVFMVEEGLVTRAETATPVPTSVGFTVGAPIDAIKKKVPSVQIEPHQYDSYGHYLTFKTKDGKAAVLMEEADGRVTNVRGGLIPAVQYVEGCL